MHVTVVFFMMLLASFSTPFHIPFRGKRFAARLFSTNSKDETFMRLALRQAQHAFREREVPIGAVIVDENDVVLSASRNQVIEFQDATSHAEINCIKQTSQFLKQWRLSNCTLYTTLEPCPMCFGAIQAARIKRVVYGAKDNRLGALGTFVDLRNHPFHSVELQGGLLEEESSLLLRRFFQEVRKENGKEIDSGHFDRGIPVE